MMLTSLRASRAAAFADEVLRLELLDVSRDYRPRPDQAHLALEHIDQLRQFVQAALSQQPSHPRHPRVIANLEDQARDLAAAAHLFKHRLGVDHHGAELEAAEMPAVEPDAILYEEHWTRPIQLDRDHDRQ